MENLFEIQYQKKFPFVKVSKQNLFGSLKSRVV